MAKCAHCKQKAKKLSSGLCGYCGDVRDELEASGDQTISFRRAMEIADKNGLLTPSMRAEWLPAAEPSAAPGVEE